MGNFNFFLFASQGSINTHPNGQYCCSFIFGKNVGYLKLPLAVLSKELFVEQRDHNYNRIPPRFTQCGGRYSVKDSERYRRVGVKCQYIPKYLQIKGDTGDRSYCFSNLAPITHLNLMKTGPFQTRERCFLIFLEQQKGCLIRRALKETKMDQTTVIVVTPRWETQFWHPQLLQMSIKNHLSLPNVSNLLIGPSKQNHKLIEKQNLQLLTWTVSG